MNSQVWESTTAESAPILKASPAFPEKREAENKEALADRKATMKMGDQVIAQGLVGAAYLNGMPGTILGFR